jgi:TolA-binding protein
MSMSRRPLELSRPLVLGVLAAGVLAACATTSTPPSTTAPNVPVTEYEMEPIKITAVKGPEGVHLESFDANELFERAGAALSEKRYDDAIGDYEKLLKEFGDSRYVKAAIYNSGLAYQGKKDWSAAIARLKTLVDQYGDTSDAKDAQFQIGASYAELENWPASAELFAQILERKDLTADDKIEALGRRGFAQFRLKDLDTAERTFKSALSYFLQIEAEERLQTDFYLGLCKYHLAEIPHERFRAAPLRLPEKQMGLDLEEKARLLLFAQRQYIETVKLGNAQWASASGYQIASLYEEFYDALVHAPVPPELLGKQNDEKREIYYEQLRKRIRILLEKSLRYHEQTLQMVERLGVQNEWRDKSKLAYAKLQKLLDPTYKVEFADPSAPADAAPAAHPAPPPGPPLPQAPSGRPSGSPETPPPADRSEGQKPHPPATGPIRQIL